jgi:hypothetical protein
MAFAMIVAAAGCTGDLTDLGPAKAGGGGSSGSAGSGGSGGSGGTGGSAGATMAKVTFADIQADFDAKICSSAACHSNVAAGGGGAVYLIKPMATGADLDANYKATMGEITTMPAGAEDQSALLINNLVGGGASPPHTGGTPFASTSDATYVKWLNWIKAGAPQQ